MNLEGLKMFGGESNKRFLGIVAIWLRARPDCFVPTLKPQLSGVFVGDTSMRLAAGQFAGVVSKCQHDREISALKRLGLQFLRLGERVCGGQIRDRFHEVV